MAQEDGSERFTTLWIGSTHSVVEREDEDENGCIACAHGYPAIEHQVSDGPVGERSESFDFTDPVEALEFAYQHADFIVIEDDFNP